MKKILSLLLCLFMIMGVTQNVVHAEENVRIEKTAIPEDQIIKNDETGIPDAQLYHWALFCADENKDNILTKQEALNYDTELYYGGGASKTISLKGLSYFKNLKSFGYGEGGGYIFRPNEHLTLTNQEELLKLERLEYLSFVYTDNVDLDVISKLNKLDDLNVSCSSFKDKTKLSLLSNVKSLKRLDFYYLNEKLTTYNLDSISDCKSVLELYLHGNKITNISPISKMTQLDILSLETNLIDDVSSLTKLINLKELALGENLLKTIPNFKGLTKLEKLLLGYNYLTENEIKGNVPNKFADDKEFIEFSIRQREGAPAPDVEKPEVNDKNLEKPYDKTLTNIPNDFIDKIYDSKDGVVITLSNTVKVSPEIFEAAKKEGKTISFEIVDEKGKLAYSWTFDGKKSMDTIGNSLDLSLSFNSDKKNEIESITNAKDSFYLNFSHHGDLPTVTKMKVKVDSKYKDGDGVYLYYFNEETNKVEIAHNLALVVKDGYVEFDLIHCSTYFLTPTKISDEIANETTQQKKPVQTSDETTIAYLTMLVCVSLIGFYVLRKKENN